MSTVLLSDISCQLFAVSGCEQHATSSCLYWKHDVILLIHGNMLYTE